MLHRIRLGLKDGQGFGTKTKLGGNGSEVEIDEAFIGGKAKNMHRSKAKNYATSGTHHGKTIVLGMLDRDQRTIRAKVLPNVQRETLQNEVLKSVKFGSKVYTDNSYGYDLLHSRFIHEFVNHAERYVNGQVHTNGLENFWSLLKRNLRGTYVAVEPFHLDRYLDEQIFRYNNRGDRKNKVTDSQRFDLAMSQVFNKRLTFAEVTGKSEEAPF